eukprot:CAMPEP_0119067668 /NCGR_PEP_ID=MMETSP1178-20130426/10042_1 /TAXON_ID=33656 /ORGANISM="unid sp, Strain CCMP2000" /LENGTH=65 /DNA_ID=CAMNT_0007049343 /DNA_START=274 /DNA_END=471 /DNA_ORIENTATION=-
MSFTATRPTAAVATPSSSLRRQAAASKPLPRRRGRDDPLAIETNRPSDQLGLSTSPGPTAKARHT